MSDHTSFPADQSAMGFLTEAAGLCVADRLARIDALGDADAIDSAVHGLVLTLRRTGLAACVERDGACVFSMLQATGQGRTARAALDNWLIDAARYGLLVSA